VVSRHNRAIAIAVLMLFINLVFPLTLSASTKSDAMLDEVAQLLKENYVDPVPSQVLKVSSIGGILKALGDPYAVYYTKEEYKRELELLNGNFTGVGIVFSPGKEGARILELLPGSPAEQSGIKVDDLVIEAGGHSLAGLNEEQVSDIIRGPARSSVVVKIKRSGQILQFTLTRQELNIPTVDSGMINHNTGLLELYEFGSHSTQDMGTAIKKLKSENADRWILDMRDNPGGFLETALGIAGYFIGNGDTVIVKERNDQEIYPGELNDEYIDGPLIILVNENSASAAEIITAALKDQQRALILGHNTYGKGTVQQMFELSNGDMVKFTIARFYSPLDKPINGLGIKPDISVSDNQVMKAAQLLLADTPASYTGKLIRIDTDTFSLGVDPLIARRGEYWPAWTEIIKGCEAYQIYRGNEKEGWTQLNKEEIASKWPLYYPDYNFQGELVYKAGQPALKLDFLSDIRPSYLNDSNIQLINPATGAPLPIKLGIAEDKGVLVSPQKALSTGQYWLVVDNTFLRFNDGHQLSKGIIADVKVIK